MIASVFEGRELLVMREGLWSPGRSIYVCGIERGPALPAPCQPQPDLACPATPTPIGHIPTAQPRARPAPALLAPPLATVGQLPQQPPFGVAPQPLSLIPLLNPQPSDRISSNLICNGPGEAATQTHGLAPIRTSTFLLPALPLS